MSNFPKRMYDGILNVINELKQRITNIESSAGESITNYSDLNNKPSINNVELDGNKTSSQLRLASSSHTHSGYASATHTHSNYAAKSHGTHVSTLTCVTSLKINTSKDGAITEGTKQTGDVELTIETSGDIVNNTNITQVVMAIPKGTIWWFALSAPPDGWAVYEPLIGRYALGATSSIGSTVEAGLPNIKGKIGVNNYSSATKGAFYRIANGGGYAVTTAINHAAGFDASKGTVNTNGTYMDQDDSPYGKSDTVTPPSVRLLPCIKL